MCELVNLIYKPFWMFIAAAVGTYPGVDCKEIQIGLLFWALTFIAINIVCVFMFVKLRLRKLLKFIETANWTLYLVSFVNIACVYNEKTDSCHKNLKPILSCLIIDGIFVSALFILLIIKYVENVEEEEVEVEKEIEEKEVHVNEPARRKILIEY